MQSENKMFDDFVKMVNGVAGTMAGMGREAEASAREKMREWVGGQDFVGRDEFEAVKAMAAAARDENEILAARIASLEAKVAGPPAASRTGGGKPQANPGGGNRAGEKIRTSATMERRSRCSSSISRLEAGLASERPRARSWRQQPQAGLNMSFAVSGGPRTRFSSSLPSRTSR